MGLWEQPVLGAGYGLVRVSGPASEPVSLDEAKAQCRVTHAAEDAYVTRLVKAARHYVEERIDRTLLPTTWRLSLSRWPRRGWVLLPRPMLRSITSVTYLDGDGETQTVSPSAYALDADRMPGLLMPGYDLDWPTGREQSGAVRVTYEAGYADAASVPEDLRQAILLLTAHWYANREAVLTAIGSKEVEFSVSSLTSPHWSGMRSYTFD